MVDGAAGLANTLGRRIAGARGPCGDGLRARLRLRGRIARHSAMRATVSAGVSLLAKGVQEAGSHDALPPKTSFTPKGFALQPRFPRLFGR
jgi:hypothetical protein